MTQITEKINDETFQVVPPRPRATSANGLAFGRLSGSLLRTASSSACEAAVADDAAKHKQGQQIKLSMDTGSAAIPLFGPENTALNGCDTDRPGDEDFYRFSASDTEHVPLHVHLIRCWNLRRALNSPLAHCSTGRRAGRASTVDIKLAHPLQDRERERERRRTQS